MNFNNKNEWFPCYTNSLTKFLISRGYFYIYRYKDKDRNTYVNLFKTSPLLYELIENYEREKFVNKYYETHEKIDNPKEVLKK